MLFLAVVCFLIHVYVIRTYLPHVVRIFQDKPLFIIPVGQPIQNAETVHFPTSSGLTLCGCYLAANGPRKGVIVFGLEFGSNRWSCVPYCEFLRDQGFDIFAFEVRGQGESDPHPGYDPLQWVTEYEVEDFRAAFAYLKSRPDADPRGVGLFGISKGGAAGLIAAVDDPYVRCFVTDGVFAVHTVMVPYMQKWILIYCRSSRIVQAFPEWYYRRAAYMALRQVEKQRHCDFPHLEHVIQKLAPRPLLMIHGGGDSYVKPEMARALFDLAGEPKQFWLVEGAKHNQSVQLASDEYQRRVLAFFVENLGGGAPASTPPPALSSPESLNGMAKDQGLLNQRPTEKEARPSEKEKGPLQELKT
ncbi:MAG TPA: alpha/beta fold hydrolase [Gemmataceae bacterium]|nr:alpha/beta fold hydrolase [Gemmataceae bacterium]